MDIKSDIGTLKCYFIYIESESKNIFIIMLEDCDCLPESNKEKTIVLEDGQYII